MKTHISSIKFYNKKCAVCNASFSYKAYPSTEAKQPRETCSKKCQYRLISKRERNRIYVICKNCGKTFEALPCFKRSYCSNSCYREFLKTRTGDKNPAWKPISEKSAYRNLKMSLRRKLIEGDSACEECGEKTKILEIHHIDKNRDNDSPDNLIVLCKTCHANRHQGERAYNIILKSENYKVAKRRPRKNCKQCGKEFIVYNKNLQFCSRQCSGAYVATHATHKTKKFVCENCGKEFVREFYRKRKFCSIKCYRENHSK